MAKEQPPKTKILSHSAAALGGVAVGVLAQRRRNNRLREANQVARFNALRLRGDVKQAERDDLTNLPKRRAITATYEGLATAASQRQRSGEREINPKADRHSFIMLDLDHFTDINNSKGHNKGDEVLRLVADTVTSRVRERDVVARWGGEEIAVLLPRATEADATDIAEELKESLEATGQVTASFGVVEMDMDKPLEDNIALADQALYAAKEAGRNQVVAYSSLEPN